MKRVIYLILLILSCTIFPAGCRVRLTEDYSERQGAAALSGTGENRAETNLNNFEENIQTNLNESLSDTGNTVENPDAARKEYDENASAEIIEGTDRLIHGEGEGSGSFRHSADSTETDMKLNETSEETALLTAITEEAEETGVSEDGKQADSVLQYYTTLLQERGKSLFECKRMYVYWETAADHMTIHKSSPEHTLILNAGAYDVSARLQQDKLNIDDGWVVRKNPNVIVKVTGNDVLGSAVRSTEAAETLLTELNAREDWNSIDAIRNARVLLLSEELLSTPYLQIGAMLVLAGTANPDLYEDVDPTAALQKLIEEATGSVPNGIFFFAMGQ